MFVTLPGLYNGNDGAFLNGTSGMPSGFTSATVPVVGALGATASDITRVGAGIVGSQAVEVGSPLMTNDAELSKIVTAAGGTVR